MVFCLLSTPFLAYSETPELNRIPETGKGDPNLIHMSDKNSGFWWSVDLSSGVSLRHNRPGKNKNGAFGELDAIGGYRLNEYLMAGAGFGMRYYFPAHHLSAKYDTMSFPLFVNVRGSFVPTMYRDVAPYYSFDIGGTIQEGFMVRPTVGLRIGKMRQACVLGLTYTCQAMRTIDAPDKTSYISFLSLRVGYEF